MTSVSIPVFDKKNHTVRNIDDAIAFFILCNFLHHFDEISLKM